MRDDSIFNRIAKIAENHIRSTKRVPMKRMKYKTKKKYCALVLNDVSVYVQMNAKFYSLTKQSLVLENVCRALSFSIARIEEKTPVMTFIFNADKSLSESFIFHFSRRTTVVFPVCFISAYSVRAYIFNTLVLVPGRVPYQFWPYFKLSLR